MAMVNIKSSSVLIRSLLSSSTRTTFLFNPQLKELSQLLSSKTLKKNNIEQKKRLLFMKPMTMVAAFSIYD